MASNSQAGIIWPMTAALRTISAKRRRQQREACLDQRIKPGVPVSRGKNILAAIIGVAKLFQEQRVSAGLHPNVFDRAGPGHWQQGRNGGVGLLRRQRQQLYNLAGVTGFR